MTFHISLIPFFPVGSFTVCDVCQNWKTDKRWLQSIQSVVRLYHLLTSNANVPITTTTCTAHEPHSRTRPTYPQARNPRKKTSHHHYHNLWPRTGEWCGEQPTCKLLSMVTSTTSLLNLAKKQNGGGIWPVRGESVCVCCVRMLCTYPRTHAHTWWWGQQLESLD